MEKSTHSERVAVALKIQAACAAALDAKGPAREADGYRPMDDRWRMAGDVCRRIDVVEIVQAMGEPRLPFEGEVETFEFFAKATHLNTGKRANGEYADPSCFRAWNIWQMAMMFKKWNNIDTNEESMQQDAPQNILPLLDEEPVNTTCSDVVRMLEADCRDPEEAETVIAAPAPTTAAEAVAQAKELAKADAAPSPAPVEPVIQFGDEGAPPTLKLGVICERLKFTVNAEFLAQLGFPATVERGSRLYHEGQFPLICGSIIKHITAVANQFIQPEESDK